MSTRLHAAESGYTYSTEADLVVFSCARCGILHGLPDDFIERRRADGRAYYCPNGHSLSFYETTEDKLKRQLEIQRSRAGRLAHERDQAEASRIGQKAAATRARNERDRVRKRAKAGVCPCCNRTFKQLARHMTSQHPDFDPNETQEGGG